VDLAFGRRAAEKTQNSMLFPVQGVSLGFNVNLL
jgi:hypothetical protein